MPNDPYKISKIVYFILDKERLIDVVRSHRFHTHPTIPQIHHLVLFFKGLDLTSDPHLI